MTIKPDSPPEFSLPGTDPIIRDARIRYVNIDSLLADSKAYRSSKYNAFMVCRYHDFVDVLMLEKGEMCSAVRFTPTMRFFVPCHFVLNTIRQRRDGLLNVFETELEVMGLTCSTVLLSPCFDCVPSSVIDIKALFKFFLSGNWSGLLEFSRENMFHYLTISQGKPKKVFLGQGTPAPTGIKAIQYLVDLAGHGGLCLSAYQFPVQWQSTIYRQAHPSQISLLCSIINDIVTAITRHIGVRSVQTLMMSTCRELLEDYPLLHDFRIDLPDKVVYNGLAQPDTMTETTAMLLRMFVMSVRNSNRIPIDSIIEEAMAPYRTTLATMSFFRWFSRD